jgi:hypothetical protein
VAVPADFPPRPELPHNYLIVREVAGDGQDAGFHDEGVAVGLGGLVVGVGEADGDAAGEKDEPAEVVESFAAVELAADLFLALILSTVALSRRRVRTSRIPGRRVQRTRQLPIQRLVGSLLRANHGNRAR